MDTLSGKTVLVTGATGFIGAHLLRRLRAITGIRLIVLTRRALDKSDAKIVFVTCALEELTPEVWMEHGIDHIDLIFHLAALIPKSASKQDDANEIYRDNVLGTAALLRSLPSGPKRIIFSSTIDVYARPPEGTALSEETRIDPLGPYAISKISCEDSLVAYARDHGCEHTVLRYGHVYGPGEGAYAKLIPQAIRTLLQNESPILYGDGSTQRDFIFVGDAVEATIRTALTPRCPIGPINIASGSSRPIREFVDILARLVGFSGGVRYLLEKRPGPSLRVNTKRMRESLGSWDLFPLEAGLAEEIEYFREEEASSDFRMTRRALS